MRNGDYILVIAPDWFQGKKYRDRYCYEHHLVWEQYNKKPVPDGYIIHHRDGNKHNNCIDNLELLKNEEHVRMHSTKGRKIAVMCCPECKKIFEREYRLTRHKGINFCSLRCSGIFYGRATKDEIEQAKKDNFIKFVRK